MKRFYVLGVLALLLLCSIGFLNATVIIDPAGDGGFENGTTFASNNWNVANHTTDIWFDGTATYYGASGRAAYISNDGGVNNNYQLTVAQTSHFYRDITIPAGELATLEFKWKAGGESTYDRILVYIAPTTVTPVAGTPVSSSTVLTGATLLGMYNLNAPAWSTASILLNGYTGTQRLIFTWQSDTSGGVMPGGALDNISITSIVPPPPLTGIKTINPAGSGINNYTTFTAAINALNLSGVGTNGVTFNVSAGVTFNEAAILPVITATGTSANPIIFQKSGTGANPIVTAPGTTGTTDYVFKIQGGDYITFDGIDVTNVTGITTMEYGYWFLGLTGNGCTNNTVKNCAITLDRTNTYTKGIYTSTISGGPNNSNNFQNVTVNNTYYGIQLMGISGSTDNNNVVQYCTLNNNANYSTYIGYQTSGLVHHNTINYPTAAITSSLYGLYLYYCPSLDVYNNIITGGNTSSNYYNIYPYYCGSANIYNNSISGASVTSSNAYYGYYPNYCTGTMNFYNNTISNISGTSTAIIYGMYVYYGAATQNIYGNSINTLSSTGGTIYGINIYYPTTANTYSNVINTLSSSGTGVVYGIYTAATYSNVYKNKVYGLAANGTSGAAYGLYVASGTTVSLYNNYVGGLTAPATSTALAVNGLYISGGTTVNAYYNTVYLSGTSTGTLFGSSCVYASTTPSLNLRNNIFVNACTPVGATGFACAYRRSTTTLTTYAATSNNNLFYAGVPLASKLIFYDGTNSDQIIATYKTRVLPRDGSSFTENPTFIESANGASPNYLHINTSVATQIESGAVNLTGITDDYDSIVRAGNPSYTGLGVAPDVGADEGDFVGLDLAPPAITYTILPMSTITGNRILSNVAITDFTGVNTTTLKPRIYFKRNADPWYSSEGTLNSGTAQSGVWSFTINATMMGALTAGDVVSYYVIAQDTSPTPNIGSNPAGAVSTDVNNVTTPPAVPNTYTIATAITGDILVGSGQTYTSLTGDDAAGLFKKINNSVVTGNVYIKIMNDLTETGAIALNQFVEEGAGNYTITIQPNDGSPKLISGALASNALIRLNDADRVSFDGRYAGSGNNLTFTNTSATSPVTFGLGIATNGAQNNTIRNCNIYTGVTGAIPATSKGINIQNDSDGLLIDSNVITRCTYGIYSAATAVGTALDNMTISNNTIGDAATITNSIGYYGIYAVYCNGLSVYHNTIVNIRYASGNCYGIYIGTSVLNSTINRNTIDDLKYTSTGGYSGIGIYVSTGSATSNLTIANNMITRCTGDGYSSIPGGGIVGINISGSTGGIRLYDNSVYQTGSVPRSSATVAAALYLASTVTNLDIRNNIFVNDIVNPSYASKAYAVFSDAPASAFTGGSADINYNDYFVSGTQGVLGYIGAADKTTLADWRTATGKDLQSITADPKFMDVANLHIMPGFDAVNALAQVITPAIPGVTTIDIDNEVRAATPDIGADEYVFVPPAGPPGPVTLLTPIDSFTPALSPNGLTLSWSQPITGTPATYYTVFVSSTPFLDWENMPDCFVYDTVGPVLSFNLTAAQFAPYPEPRIVLAYNSQWYWAVQANSATLSSIMNDYHRFQIIPDPRVTLPYTENFDGGMPNLAINPAGAWVIGTPAKTNGYIVGAHTVPNAIVTRSLTANYNAYDDMNVAMQINTTPLVRNLNIEFWQKYNTEVGFDGMCLEYSVDNMATWVKWDAIVGTGVNYDTAISTFWYNNTLTYGPMAPPKWSSFTSNVGSGTDYQDDVNGWINSTTVIPYSIFGTAGNLALRWHFMADLSGQYDGFAIDDINIWEEAPITIPPDPVTMVTPLNAATGIDPRTVILDWSPAATGGSVQNYDLYVSNNPGNMTGQQHWVVTPPTSQYSPFATGGVVLDYNTTWYWLVQPSNIVGPCPIGTCPVWSFTTKPQMSVTGTGAFGAVFTGVINTRAFTILNAGTNTVNISTIQITSGAPQFTLTGLPTLPVALGENISTTFNVQFYSTTAGVFTGNLRIVDDLARAVYNVPLSATASDVSGGYFMANSFQTTLPSYPTYNWIDISATGTTITDLSDDNYSATVTPLGITFPFFGVNYTDIWVGSNGILTFGSGTASRFNVAIPTVGTPDNFIAWFWDDLNPADTDVTDDWVKYQTVDGKFVITYYKMPMFNSLVDTNAWISAQVILYPSGKIKMQYTNYGSTMVLNTNTIGIENSTGTMGLQYRLDAVGGPIFGPAGEPLALAFGTDILNLGEVPALAAPTVTITADEFSTTYLHWNTVPGANSVYIYSTTDPVNGHWQLYGGPFGGNDLPVGFFPDQLIRFFRVVASSDAAGPAPAGRITNAPVIGDDNNININNNIKIRKASKK